MRPGPDDPSGEFILIRREWCKGCGLCTALCARKVYESDAYGQPVIADEALCNQCMQCVERCPEFAIEVKKTVRAAAKKGAE
jgi:2-oxoglutarate ferredoxin oxidoreductase subunit delta